MTEREAHEERLAHLLLTISHRLERLLLVVDFFVLGHVRFVGEVVEVARVGLGVKLRDEGGAGLAEGRPIHFSEVGVRVDVLNVGEAAAARVDSTKRSVCILSEDRVGGLTL